MTHPVLNDLDSIPSNEIKITTANNMVQSRTGPVGSLFSMTATINKVLKNYAYTAPRPPVPVVPTRPNTSMSAARSSAATLQPMSRTLQKSTAETSTATPTPPLPTFSPLEGTKITVTNLHPQGNVITSDQPILLRLSDTPGAGSSSTTKKDGLPPSLSHPNGQRASSQLTPEVDPQTILKTLFKSTTQSTFTTEAPISQTTAFRIKI
ncbi:hypothetical protein XENOCAPTIV_020693 [Xenoophorus captivus]|uniref:Uncharacterized protein n=1 Tax=Xenoophorus captivus TaxID=1517983 RepID=A0ABV0QJB8_9TELE